MNKKLIITFIACVTLASSMNSAFAQNDPGELKKRAAQKEIASVAVDWMGQEEEGGRLYKRIFQSTEEGDRNTIKFALEDLVPIDTSPMAKMTHLGLAKHGSIYITYADGQKDQIDVGCGYGYFAGGSRAVSSAFHSGLLTKWLMRAIDQCKNCGRLNLYAGCFAPMAGKDPLNNVIELKIEPDKDTIVKGDVVRAKLTFTNTGQMSVYFYGYCGRNVLFKVNDQWGGPRFASYVDRNYENKMPQEQDFIRLGKGETFTCNSGFGGKEFWSAMPRYYGTHLLIAEYENIASYEDYCSGGFFGEAITVHFAESQPIKIDLVRNWAKFQRQFHQMPKNGDKEMVGSYLGPPDNKIPNFKDERGQPLSEQFMKLDEWVYEQPFADKDGKRSRVIIRFRNNQVADVAEEGIE